MHTSFTVSGFFEFLHHKLELCAHSLGSLLHGSQKFFFCFCLVVHKRKLFNFSHNNLFYVNQSGSISLAFLPKNNLFHVNPSYLIFGSLFESFILLFTKELLHCSLEIICLVLITTTQVMKSLVCFIDKRKLFPKELFCYAGLFGFAASLRFVNMVDIYYYYYFFPRMTH
jgi:hypothetical protein